MSDDEFSEDYESNNEEEYEFDDIEDKNTDSKQINKISVPIMWDYEKANIITARKEQLDKGSPTFLEDVGDLVSSYDIAMKEFEQGKIKYELLRYIGKNFEIWRHEDFLYFPN